MQSHRLLLSVCLFGVAILFSSAAYSQEQCDSAQREKEGCGGQETCVVRPNILFPDRRGTPNCEVSGSDTWVAYNCLSTKVNYRGEKYRPRCRIEWNGPITRADADRLVDLLDAIPKNERPLQGLSISVVSSGGDVYAALDLGRKLRLRNAEVWVERHCASACVFLLAAGTTKHVVGGDVVIHRPYSLDTSRSDMTDLQQVYDETNRAVADYLSDMNIPDSLLEAMLRVPPHRGKRLSDSELDAYGLNRRDPVYEQALNASAAQSYGMTMTEYLGYKKRAEDCRARYSSQDWSRYCSDIWPERERSPEAEERSRRLREFLEEIESGED